jgi:hypothetical protein
VIAAIPAPQRARRALPVPVPVPGFIIRTDAGD